MAEIDRGEPPRLAWEKSSDKGLGGEARFFRGEKSRLVPGLRTRTAIFVFFPSSCRHFWQQNRIYFPKSTANPLKIKLQIYGM